MDAGRLWENIPTHDQSPQQEYAENHSEPLLSNSPVIPYSTHNDYPLSEEENSVSSLFVECNSNEGQITANVSSSGYWSTNDQDSSSDCSCASEHVNVSSSCGTCAEISDEIEEFADSDNHCYSDSSEPEDCMFCSRATQSLAFTFVPQGLQSVSSIAFYLPSPDYSPLTPNNNCSSDCSFVSEDVNIGNSSIGSHTLCPHCDETDGYPNSSSSSGISDSHGYSDSS